MFSHLRGLRAAASFERRLISGESQLFSKNSLYANLLLGNSPPQFSFLERNAENDKNLCPSPTEETTQRFISKSGLSGER